MTRAVRDLSVVTNTPQGFKSVTQYGGAADNFDSGSASRLDFYVDEESIILEAKLRLAVSAYRVWASDTAAGGASTPTTAAGGSSTPTSSTANAHRHQVFDFSTAGPISSTVDEFNARDVDGNPTFVYFGAGDNKDVYTWTSDGAHSHLVSISSHQHSVTIPSHTHEQTYEVVEVEGTPGDISVALDGTNVDSVIGGPFTTSSLPATFDADFSGVLSTPGWHTLTISTVSGHGRLTPYIVVQSLMLQ